MKNLTRRRGSLIAVAAVIVIAAAFAAIHTSQGSAAKPASAKSAATTKAGTYKLLRVTWDQPDYFDPGLAYTVAAWQIMWNVYGGLLGYKHANGAAGATLVPYLATALPKITNGGKTY